MIAPRVEVRVDESLPTSPRLRQALQLGLRDALELLRALGDQRFRQEAHSHLGSGLRVQVRASGEGVRGTLGTPRFEARLLETGTKAHLIKPRPTRRRRGRIVQRGKQALAIPLKSGGVIFRRKIQHPGQRPRRWLSESVLAGTPDARAALEARLREVFGLA